MIDINNTIICLLLNCSQRKAGSFEKDGETVKYGVADRLTVIKLGDPMGKLQTYYGHSSMTGKLVEATADLHWGAVLRLTLDRYNKIIDLEILGDVMEPFYRVEL